MEGPAREPSHWLLVAELWLSMCLVPQSLSVRLTKGGAGGIVRHLETYLSGIEQLPLQAEGEPGVLDPLFLWLRQRKSGCGKHLQRCHLVPGPLDLGLLRTGLGS